VLSRLHHGQTPRYPKLSLHDLSVIAGTTIPVMFILLICARFRRARLLPCCCSQLHRLISSQNRVGNICWHHNSHLRLVPFPIRMNAYLFYGCVAAEHPHAQLICRPCHPTKAFDSSSSCCCSGGCPISSSCSSAAAATAAADCSRQLYSCKKFLRCHPSLLLRATNSQPAGSTVPVRCSSIWSHGIWGWRKPQYARGCPTKAILVCHQHQ
jgi:hypothetical protein